MHESMTSFIVLACILPVIVLTLFILKKTMNSRFTGNQHIKIINQISVGSKERLLLLQIDKDVILVGVTPHQISTLHVMANMSGLTSLQNSSASTRKTEREIS